MTSMDDLITWLRAQLDDDYETARLVLGVNAMAGVINGTPAPRWVRSEGTSGIEDTKGIARVGHTWAREAEHITRWDPARALAEVDAKRQIVDLCTADIGYEDEGLANGVLQRLALPYADRPGYREEWRP